MFSQGKWFVSHENFGGEFFTYIRNDNLFEPIAQVFCPYPGAEEEFISNSNLIAHAPEMFYKLSELSGFLLQHGFYDKAKEIEILLNNGGL